MDNPILILAVIGISVLLAGLVLFVVSLRFVRGNRMSRRLQDFVVDYSRTPLGREQSTGVAPVLLQEQLQGSLISRTIVPGMRRFANFLGKFTPQRSAADLNRQLMVAGVNLRPVEFLGIRVFCFLLGMAIVVGLFYLTKRSDMVFLLLYLLTFLLFQVLPSAWLASKVRFAQDEVRRGLPDALDMLSVCTFAGLGFDQALQRVSDYWHTALGDEFRRVVQELELGVSRGEALHNMSERLQVSELSSFVAVIVQADSIGTPISDVLHGQADQMRIIRQFRAREIASRLPAKMMFPLALLILPALMAVILSPVVPSLLGLFGAF